MKVECLASSSAGNCFILDFEIEGVSTKIMIECGIPLAQIYSKLTTANILISDIQCCLITHYHKDHSLSASKLESLGIPIFASKGTLEQLSCKGKELIPKTPIRVLNGLFVMAFPVEHDAEGSMGFVIKTKTECVIFINDCKRWTCDLSSFKPNYVFIECNYDHNVVYPQIYYLKKRKDEIAYEDEEMREINTKLKQFDRNVNAHMSLSGCIQGLRKLNLTKCNFITLVHLSDRYANEYKMKIAVQNEFGIRTLVAKKYGGIK